MVDIHETVQCIICKGFYPNLQIFKHKGQNICSHDLMELNTAEKLLKNNRQIEFDRGNKTYIMNI